jgi:hypothetical protein
MFVEKDEAKMSSGWPRQKPCIRQNGCMMHELCPARQVVYAFLEGAVGVFFSLHDAWLLGASAAGLTPFVETEHDGVVDGELAGVLASLVWFGVGEAAWTSTRRPGDVGAVDIGVGCPLLGDDSGNRDSETRRVMASICLLVAPDLLSDGRCAASFSTNTILSAGCRARTSFSVMSRQQGCILVSEIKVPKTYE